MATALHNPSPHQAAPLSASPQAPGVGPGDPAALPGPSLARILLNALATAAILAALLLLQGCGRGDEAAAAPPAAPAGAVAEAAPPQNTDAIPPTPAPVVFAVGQAVTAGADIVVVGDAAAAAPVLEVYSGGAAFSVLEPGLDRGAYPIIADGVSWVRVRAGDGLAGWVNAAWLMQ